MRCRTALTRIDAMRTGELSAPESSQVHDHLRTCRSCDESLADIETLTTSLKELVVQPPQSLKNAAADHFDILKAGGDEVLVAFSGRGLRMITTGVSANEFRAMYAQKFGRDLTRGDLPDRLRRQVVSALTGEGVHKPAVDFAGAGDFERKVLEILTKIPRGQVRTYTWVARQAGRPKAVRAVGNICARNIVPFVVPCHRVVPSAGGIGNYAFGTPVKRALLRREGVPVDELDELARHRLRYVGSKTTNIYCFPTCSDARRTKEKNRVTFHNGQEAAAKGFRPCKHCRPCAA